MRTATQIEINAPVEQVWAQVMDFPSHATWMRDARAVRVEPEQATGVGALLIIDTRVGPFRTTDRFRITEVEPMRLLAGQHLGLFTGEGRFEITELEPGRTQFVWRENIRFPWFFAGRLGEWIAQPILTRVWHSNLKKLKQQVETGT